jgi:hypothetical protein
MSATVRRGGVPAFFTHDSAHTLFSGQEVGDEARAEGRGRDGRDIRIASLEERPELQDFRSALLEAKRSG